jgi:signal transduction histidine kinase
MGRTRLTTPALGAAVLALALVGVNALAILGIVAARSDARRAARQELELRTVAQGRALEAAMASLRADLVFISRSPTLLRVASEPEPADPLVRRWSRLDAEATILLFLEAHPSIEELTLHRDDGPLLRAGRRGGAPTLTALDVAAPPSERLAVSSWPLGSSNGARLEAWVDPLDLMPAEDPQRAAVELVLNSDRPQEPPFLRDALAASVAVTDEGWSPPPHWRLIRHEERGELARSLDVLASRFGVTVALNLAVMASSLGLGWWALRNMRRSARLEAEHQQQARVRELERQLVHGQRLASVGRLAAGFAHEINNPLEGISNYLAALRCELDSGRTTDARALVDRASEGVTRAAGVIRQILAFSEQAPPAKEDLDLREVVHETAAFLRSNPRYRQADLQLALGSEPALVHGNAVTLGQLTLNLLLNALQAEPARGPVEVSLDHDRGDVTLEIRDRGPGLAPDIRDRLFEPFTSTRGSTGLGLAVCRGIVDDHSGRIAAHDRDGGGAVFSVRLPAHTLTGSELVRARSGA